MSNNLVSMQNLQQILQGVRAGVISKIDAKDVTPEQLAIINKANILDVTTNNSKFLADDGTYKAIDATAAATIHEKTQVVMDLFDIVYDDTTTTYNLNLPLELQNKLDLIVDTGDGTKVLADNGQYIDIPLGYRFMTATEESTMVSTINSYTGA